MQLAGRKFAVFLAIFMSSQPAMAGSVSYSRDRVSTGSISTGSDVVVKNDSGGYVATYAIEVAQLARGNRHVRIAGRCDSACTMYLGLPRDKICLEPDAYFRFHKPSARSEQTVEAATRLLMRNYPAWVRQWIADNGGLTATLKTMDFEYASSFLPVCGNVT
jgi:hypothetical protein